jgi:type I restriction enzyme S subunit
MLDEKRQDQRVLDWVGGVPDRWELHSLGSQLAANKSSNRGLVEKRVLSLSYGRVIVKPQDKLRGLVPESFETYQIVEPGDIVIRPTDLQNDHTSLRVGQSMHRGIITSAYICLRPTDSLNHRYASYLLTAYDFMKVFYGFGSGLRQNLDVKHIKHIPVPVPGLEEQGLIVRYLDHAELRIANAIAAKTELAKLLQQQRLALLCFEVLGRGEVADNDRDFGQLAESRVLDWVGPVPENWDVVPMSGVFDVVKQKNIGLIENTVLSLSYGRVVIKPAEKLRGLVPESFETYQLIEPDDVIVRPTDLQNDTTSLRIGQARDRGIITSAYIALRPNKHVDPDYVMMQLAAYDFLKVLYGFGSGLRQNLDFKHLKHVPMVLPSVVEQSAIVARVRSKTESVERAHAAIIKEIALLKEYRTRLISDVVTGKLDVREQAANLPEIDPMELAVVSSTGAVNDDDEESSDVD